MQKSSFNKLSILLFIIVILSSCNKDNGIEEISESYIEIKVLRISKEITQIKGMVYTLMVKIQLYLIK